MPASFVDLTIGLQAIVQPAQTIANDRRAEVVPLSPQLRAKLPQAQRRPQSPSHRITSRHRFKQRPEVGKQSWILGDPGFTPTTSTAYPVIPNCGTIFEIFKSSIYCPAGQTRRLSHRANTAMSNHTCFRRRPASSAPLIQQRNHRLPTVPKSFDGRSAYHATILPPQIPLKESPSYNSRSA